MGKKFCLTVNQETIDFCKLNGIEDIREFVVTCYRKGLAIERYGETPMLIPKEKEVVVEEKEVIKEVVKEVIKEVPVDKIIEKEVIVEVPVEKIVEKKVEVPVEVIREVIKEVPVDKIVEVEKEVVVYKETPVEIVKEVEKIVEKEVPVEKIKEIEVIKEVYVTDDEQVNELGGKIAKLEEENRELSQKVTKLVTKPPTIIEKEVPVEKIKVVEKEIPIEVIKEVEKPVEVIKEVIKEVYIDKPVEKIVKVVDDTKIKELTDENERLKDSLTKYDEMFAQFEKKVVNKKNRRDNLYDD
jgi:hypothetical protein